MTISVNEKETIWVERYRPQRIEECILPDALKNMFLAIVKDGKIPNMIFHSSSPGTGKTTVAHAICKSVGADCLFWQGSNVNLDFIRTTLSDFCRTSSFDGSPKVVFLDEFDVDTARASYALLRSFIEQVSQNCTFIITANNLSAIPDAIRSRCTPIEFGNIPKDEEKSLKVEMLKRCREILKLENITIEEPKVLGKVVNQHFPNFRNILGKLDLYSKCGVIDVGILSQVSYDTNPIQIYIDSIKSKNFAGISESVVNFSSDYPNFIKNLFKLLKSQVQEASIPNMIEAIGENNQTYGVAANLEIHATYLGITLAHRVIFK